VEPTVWSSRCSGPQDLRTSGPDLAPVFFMCRDGEWMESGNGASDQIVRAREQSEPPQKDNVQVFR
jgi:hypothetical protein